MRMAWSMGYRMVFASPREALALMGRLHDAGAMADARELLAALSAVAPADAVAWLESQRARIAAGDMRALFLAISQAGRKVGRTSVANPVGWTSDQVARVLLVLALPSEPAVAWLETLERIFHAGTVDELVALYQALPLYSHPQRLVARAAEGVRSNMRPVFEAVALNNPFPAAHLDDAAWNQMVLKCFFLAADVDRVIGIDQRRNSDLGRMLADYARERRVASRSVDKRLPPLARACGAECLDSP